MRQNEGLPSSEPANDQKADKRSKLERAKQAANANTEDLLAQGEKNLAQLAQQAENLRLSRLQNAEELALLIEPLCQTLAQLTEDTRATFQALQREAQSAHQQRIKEQEAHKKEVETLSQNFQKQIQASTEGYTKAANTATGAARALHEAGQRLEWSHYLLVATVSLLATLFSTALGQWVYPPRIENNVQIDTERLLQRLKQEQEIFLGPPQDRPAKPQTKSKPKP
jgi:Mobilization protein B